MILLLAWGKFVLHWLRRIESVGVDPQRKFGFHMECRKRRNEQSKSLFNQWTNRSVFIWRKYLLQSWAFASHGEANPGARGFFSTSENFNSTDFNVKVSYIVSRERWTGIFLRAWTWWKIRLGPRESPICSAANKFGQRTVRDGRRGSRPQFVCYRIRTGTLYILCLKSMKIAENSKNLTQ